MVATVLLIRATLVFSSDHLACLELSETHCVLIRLARELRRLRVSQFSFEHPETGQFTESNQQRLFQRLFFCRNCLSCFRRSALMCPSCHESRLT
jgi:hypothetical protein